MPTLFITCGLSGTGKSTVAKIVSEITGAEVIRSDVVRKELAGISPEKHSYVSFNTGIYSGEFTKKTYQRMTELASDYLKSGRDVLLDATFTKRWQRDMARNLAESLNTGFKCLVVTCPEEVVIERLRNRMMDGKDVSDGREEIYFAQKRSYEPPDEIPPENIIEISLPG